MAIGKTSGVYIATIPAVKYLLEGVAVCIDPSVGSRSSQPGFAVYKKQVLVESGVFRLPPDKPVFERLRLLATQLRRLYTKYDPDVLIFEDIPSMRHGGGNAAAHASLLKAVGVILSVPGPPFCIGIQPVSWKPNVCAAYIKGDEYDAVEIGRIVVELAGHIHAGTKMGKKVRIKNV